MLGMILAASFASIMLLNANDRREREAIFMQQCDAARYDLAHCRFFFTISQEPGGAVAMAAILAVH
jgi:hypothetical protein